MERPFLAHVHCVLGLWLSTNYNCHITEHVLVPSVYPKLALLSSHHIILVDADGLCFCSTCCPNWNLHLLLPPRHTKWQDLIGTIGCHPGNHTVPTGFGFDLTWGNAMVCRTRTATVCTVRTWSSAVVHTFTSCSNDILVQLRYILVVHAEWMNEWIILYLLTWLPVLGPFRSLSWIRELPSALHLHLDLHPQE